MSVILGVDEVGRGCWAGPVVAGAVILSKPILGLKDSKVLSFKKRQYLADQVHANADAVGIGWVSSKELDAIGLTKAVGLAMKRAVEKISHAYDTLIIDGNFNFMPDNLKSQTLVKADSKILEVSAASIVAKVARDQFMIKASVNYPYYGFEKHVGYGTKFHANMLQLHGPCDIHRLSFKPISKLAR